MPLIVVVVAVALLGLLAVLVPQGPRDNLAAWSEAVGPPKLNRDTDALIVYKPDTGARLDLTAAGITVIQDYESFTAIVATSDGVSSLVRHGYRFEVLQEVKAIGLAPYVYDYTQGPPSIPADLQLPWTGTASDYPVLVKFLAPPLAGWLDEIERLGAGVGSYAGSFTYLVRMPGTAVRSVMGLRYVAWIEPYHYIFRAPTDLMDAARRPPPFGAEIPLTVVGMPWTSQSDLESGVRAAGGRVESVYDSGQGIFLDCHAPIASVLWLVHEPGVYWVERRSTQVGP